MSKPTLTSPPSTSTFNPTPASLLHLPNSNTYTGDWIFFLHSLISLSWVDMHNKQLFIYRPQANLLIFLDAFGYLFYSEEESELFQMIILNKNVFFVKRWDNVQSPDSCSVLKHLRGLRAFYCSFISVCIKKLLGYLSKCHWIIFFMYCFILLGFRLHLYLICC